MRKLTIGGGSVDLALNRDEEIILHHGAIYNRCFTIEESPACSISVGRGDAEIVDPR